MPQPTLNLQRTREKRINELRNGVLRGICETIDKFDVTLVELMEFYEKVYDSQKSAVVLHKNRGAVARSNKARKAVRARWERRRQFFDGYVSRREKIKAAAAVVDSDDLGNVVPPTPHPQPVASNDSLFGGL